MNETTQLNRTIGESYNQYFTWNNNTAFYVLSPTYLFQYYNTQVRTWDEWNTGWVGSFHNTEKGLLPTQLAGSLCHKIADLIFGEGVLFESTEDKNVENDALDFINELDEDIDIRGVVKDSVLKSCQLGNSLLKLNNNTDGLWIDALAGNRFFVNLNSKGQVTKAMSYVNIYTGGVPSKDKKADSYGLVELRYYDTDEDGAYKLDEKSNPIPMVVYKIYKLNGVANVFDSNPSGGSYAFEDLPRPVRREFREEYEALKLNEPTKLPLRNLGVYLVKHTKYVSAMPNIKLGESCLARIINYLPQYDAINSEELVDLRVSRPKVVVPEFMGKGRNDNNDQLNAYSDIIFTKVPSKSDKDQTPIVFAPSLRVDSFIREKEDVIKKICGNLGIATSSLFSDIADGRGNVTAREISSEDSNTTLFVTNKRKILLPPVNEMIRDILDYYGKGETVKATFAPAGASNKTVTTDIAVKLKNAGLISEYQAIKEEHPEWSDSQVQEELDEIHKVQDTNSSNEENNATEDNAKDNEDKAKNSENGGEQADKSKANKVDKQEDEKGKDKAKTR